MPNWVTRSFKFIRDLPGRASPRWPWPLRKVRNANISAGERDYFERYGENVVAMMASSGFEGNVEHARAWLTERADSRERRERVTLLLEFIVVALIGWEISLGYRQERLQSRNFEKQQQVLTNLQNSSAATADTLAALQRTARRSAEAAESSASTASQALHVSERAYVHMTPSLRKPPSAGEKLQISVAAGNSGRTSALELAVHCAAAFVPISMPVNEALQRAFATPAQKWQSVSVLPSGGTTESPSDSPLALNQSDVEQLMGDKMYLYVFATATYKDVFKQPHHTEICTIYRPNVNRFMNCHEHNKSD